MTLIHRFLRIVAVLLLLSCMSFHNPEPTDAFAAYVHDYPQDYFAPPVTLPLLVTGTFCELRPDHFHSGLDMKSITGGVGQPVFASANGYIDQIKVQSNGYGQVLYIKHPNGYTTVYAHLDAFSAKVAEYVKEVQYQRERYEVVIDLPANKFPVKKGEEIAKMGNTGGSTGPHLHFEIRNSANNHALNPLLFGLPVPDSKGPDIRDMKVYFLAPDRSVQHEQPLPVERRKDGTYGLKGNVSQIGVGAWRIGLGIKTYDGCNALRNDNGIFGLRLEVNGVLQYEWLADEMDFDETRYLNALSDYPAHKRYGAWFHRMFVLPGDKLSMYTPTASMGAVPLSVSEPAHIVVRAKDAAGNVSTIEFDVYRSENMLTFTVPEYAADFKHGTANTYQNEGCAVSLPAGALYEDLRFKFLTTPDGSTNTYSPVYHLHHKEVPVQKYFDIAILPLDLPAELRTKAVVARCGSGKPTNCGGTWKGAQLTTRIRSFGDYCVMTDHIAPAITPVIFDDDMRRKSAMAFRISDNFDTAEQADKLYWRGTVDGEWVLFEYDSKRARLTHRFDERTAPGQHILRLLVKDDRGNETVFEAAFQR